MTLKQQYEVWLTLLMAKQITDPVYPHIEWYKKHGLEKRVKEIERYGRTVPNFRSWLDNYDTPEKWDNENLTFLIEM